MRDMEDLLEMRGGKKGFFFKKIIFEHTYALCVLVRVGFIKNFVNQENGNFMGRISFFFLLNYAGIVSQSIFCGDNGSV